MMRAMLGATILTAASAATAPAADGAKLNFQDHVLPIFRAHCGNCHNQNKAKGDVNLLDYGALMRGGASGVIVEGGNADNSRLFKVTAHTDEPKMPPSGTKIPDKDLATLKQWIDDGVIEAAGGQAKKSNKPKLDLAVKPSEIGKPSGPPAMPKGDWLLDPYVKPSRAYMPYAMATSPWAPLLAVGAQKQVLLFHSETLDLLGVLPFPEGNPYVVKFTRNGSMLLAAGGQAGKTGKAVLFKVETGERVTEVGDETDAVLAADISADQAYIAIGGSNKLVKIFSTKDGELLHTIKKHTEWVLTASFSPDGVLLATADRNGGLVVWESASGREFYTLTGHTAAVTGLAWRDDSNLLASGSEDTTIKFWEMNNGGQVKSFGAHGGGVLDLAATHDGTFVSIGRDNVVKVWKPDGNLQKQFEGFGDLAVRCAPHHDGKRAFGADFQGNIRSWNVAYGKRLAEFTTNPPTIAERLDLLQKELTAKKSELAAAQKQTTDAENNRNAAQKNVDDANKALAAADAAEKAAQAKANETKAAVEKFKAETQGMANAVPGKTAEVQGASVKATAVKEALAAALDHERALQQLAASYQTLNATVPQLAAKAQAALAKASDDGAVKAAAGRPNTTRQALDALAQQMQRSSAEAAQMVKELTDASARQNQASDARTAELAAMQSAIPERQKQFAAKDAEVKAAFDMIPKAAEAKKAATALLGERQKQMQPAVAAVGAAQAKAKEIADRIAGIPQQIDRLNRAQAFSKTYKLRAEFESKTTNAAKLADAAARAKSALEKAKLELAEVEKAAPAQTSQMNAANDGMAKVKPTADALAKEVADLQALAASKEAARKQATELAEKLKGVAAKAPKDNNAKDAYEKADAAAKAAADALTEAKKVLALKEAAKTKSAGELAAAEKTQAQAQTALTALQSKREALTANMPKLTAASEAAAAEAAKATKEVETLKVSLDAAKNELARRSAN